MRPFGYTTVYTVTKQKKYNNLSHFNITIDEITFKAACRGKTNAQRKIYELFATPVYNLAYRMTYNSSDAMDITHDVFLKIFQKITQNKDPKVFGFWVRKITLNTTLTLIKNNERVITTVDFKEKTIHADRNETLSSLEFAFNQLPKTSRTVLWLFEVEGMSHEEIAKIYGKSTSFSKTHLYRAKNLAQSLLTSKAGGYESRKIR